LMLMPLGRAGIVCVPADARTACTQSIRLSTVSGAALPSFGSSPSTAPVPGELPNDGSAAPLTVDSLIDWVHAVRASAGTQTIPALPSGISIKPWVPQFVSDLTDPADDPALTFQLTPSA